MKRITIAIDGLSSCGKSSTAKKVSEHLGYPYIDTGAMYRAATLYFLQNNISSDDQTAVTAALDNIQIGFHRSEAMTNDVYLNGVNIESEIRKMYVSEKVSLFSAIPAVRHLLVAQQQKMGENGGIVMDGRDIGTVVFPKAELKIYLTASPEVRAQRRHLELVEKGENVGLEEIAENLRLRDFNDMNRAESPLIKAEDAVLIDNSEMTFDEQVQLTIDLANQQIYAGELSNS
ncbi:(d)CMP kinase [Dyadobacter luticola]|uniref:Cytidylate kinase n=1 Tax=Dyadobacter luticola TaxID=1979387 RepID=A0A5R9L222_9BACT|nr:(d)CMP kinase [Dyadobacter luticola]TLV02375.1 (d)CMP kinase [Dyadobacter luticola]